MNPFSIYDPDSIPRLVFKVAEMQYLAANRFLKKFNLTVEQVAMLFFLTKKDGLTQKRLSDLSIKDQANTTRIVKRLLSKGLVEIRTTPTDKRLNLVYLTAEGRRLLEDVFPMMNAIGDYQCNLFGEGELNSLKKALLSYIEVYEKNDKAIEEFIENLR